MCLFCSTRPEPYQRPSETPPNPRGQVLRLLFCHLRLSFPLFQNVWRPDNTVAFRGSAIRALCYVSTSESGRLIAGKAAQVSSHKRGNACGNVARAQGAPPRSLARAEVANTSGQRHGSGIMEHENKAERSPGVRCAIKVAMKKDHKKRSCTRPQQQISNWSVRPAQVKEHTTVTEASNNDDDEHAPPPRPQWRRCNKTDVSQDRKSNLEHQISNATTASRGLETMHP